MADAVALLAAPPQALMLALAGMRQAGDLPCQVDFADLPEYLLDFVPAGEHPALLNYLDELLADAGLADASLHTLFTRIAPGDWYPQTKGARDLLAGLQRVLRNEVNNHG